MNKNIKKLHIHSFLLLSSMLLMTGCATLYQVDYNPQKASQMSLSQARQDLRQELQTGVLNFQVGVYNQPIKDVKLTQDGFTVILTDGSQHSDRFDQVQSLSVTDAGFSWYLVQLNPDYLGWRTVNDAKNFVDAFEAMKYYFSNHILVDDNSAAFADFQEKVKVWHALSPKPSLPEEARRFRVLADDAVQNKEFQKAADYYEQGLKIYPMWPAGQFNAAMIYKELNFYAMAVMHMKRYLALKPEDTQKYQDQIYIWEERAKETNE
jgi:tetratricopeptide (TPR) repeat protein